MLKANEGKVNLYSAIPILAAIGVIIYLILALAGNIALANALAFYILIIGTFPLFLRMVKKLLERQFGIDIIAISAIIFSIILGQSLAGLVTLLMLSGGEALEDYAMKKAKSNLTKLLERAPKIAHIKRDGHIVDIPLSHIKPGDVLIVKSGETIPADAIVIGGRSFVDESMITGESLPVEKRISSQVYSGTINSGKVLQIRAIRSSKESEYERIIALVKQAQESKAPIVRLADKYSVWFTTLTFGMAGGSWALTGNPITALAVLVVATPCPLILATPIAIISGISRAAKRGIIIKSGGAIEELGTVKTFVFDKTGTVTLGFPIVKSVKVLSNGKISKKEIVRIAASLDQLSAHPLAKSLVRYALKNKIDLEYPKNYSEKFGDGVHGTLNDGHYFMGKRSFLSGKGANISKDIEEAHESLSSRGETAIYLAKGHKKPEIIGAIYFSDEIKSETKAVFKLLQSHGVERTVLLTGDRRDVAEKVAKKIGVEEVISEATPGEKVRKIRWLQKANPPVAMVGDGVNDAPALATADIGITIGSHTAAAEAGDIVIPQNDLAKLGEAFKLSQRVLSVAKQGIYIGMSGSFVMMVAASLGYIHPVTGAILQEGLDVAVIINALRIIFEGRGKK